MLLYESEKGKCQLLSRVQLFATPWNTGLDCHSLLQGIFPTQGSNPDLPHCRQILYQLSHEGSPENYAIYCLKKFQFIFSNPFFFSFACFIALNRTPSMMLRKKDESRHNTCFLILTEQYSACYHYQLQDFSVDSLYWSEKGSLYSLYKKSFHHK